MRSLIVRSPCSRMCVAIQSLAAHSQFDLRCMSVHCSVAPSGIHSVCSNGNHTSPGHSAPILRSLIADPAHEALPSLIDCPRPPIRDGGLNSTSPKSCSWRPNSSVPHAPGPPGGPKHTQTEPQRKETAELTHKRPCKVLLQNACVTADGSPNDLQFGFVSVENPNGQRNLSVETNEFSLVLFIDINYMCIGYEQAGSIAERIMHDSLFQGHGTYRSYASKGNIIASFACCVCGSAGTGRVRERDNQ
jgi:hypothetical protein